MHNHDIPFNMKYYIIEMENFYLILIELRLKS